jgi:hypothetical protein
MEDFIEAFKGFNPELVELLSPVKKTFKKTASNTKPISQLVPKLPFVTSSFTITRLPYGSIKRLETVPLTRIRVSCGYCKFPLIFD